MFPERRALLEWLPCSSGGTRGARLLQGHRGHQEPLQQEIPALARPAWHHPCAQAGDCSGNRHKHTPTRGVTQEEHLGSKAFPSAPKHRRDSSPVSNSITHATKSIHPWLFLSHPTTRDTTAASERPGRPQSHVLRFREALPPWEELFLESSPVARANSQRCDAHHPPGRVWCASQERRGKELRGGMTKQGNVRNQTKCQAAEKNMATASISAQLNSYMKQARLD